jgi:hypothetical protein
MAIVNLLSDHVSKSDAVDGGMEIFSTSGGTDWAIVKWKCYMTFFCYDSLFCVFLRLLHIDGSGGLNASLRCPYDDDGDGGGGDDAFAVCDHAPMILSLQHRQPSASASFSLGHSSLLRRQLALAF